MHLYLDVWPIWGGFYEACKVYTLIHFVACGCLVVPDLFIENLLGFNQKHLIKDSFSVEPIKM